MNLPTIEVAKDTGAVRNKMSELKNGAGKSTKIGYINNNNQICHGHRGNCIAGPSGHGSGSYIYKMECFNCKNIYGSLGIHVENRKCPACQGGKPGSEF